MRQPRMLAPGFVAGVRSGIYHCVSRVVDRRMVLQEAEREHFVKLMRLYEGYCGVRVLTFAVMSNHFHILLEVPPRPKNGITDQELFRRLSLLYSEAQVNEVKEHLKRARTLGKEQAERVRERFLYRMWDLSQFMKTLKQRFTQWFNRRYDRCGTLWEERFKSVIVEDGYAARVMAAYVDLNPLRAGMVARPEDYRWSGCGEAVAGRKRAREGIERVTSQWEEFVGGRHDPKTWRQVIARYREILYTDGEERMDEDEVTGERRVARRGVSKEEAEKVRASGGKLTVGQMLRFRVRHFVDGAAIGRESFVEEVFEAERGRFGPKRESGARKIRSCETALWSLRDLRDTLA